MKDSQAYLMYVTNGNILSYEGGEKAEGNLHEATHSQMSAKLLNDRFVIKMNGMHLTENGRGHGRSGTKCERPG